MKKILNHLRLIGAGMFILFSISAALAQNVETLYDTPTISTFRDNYSGAEGCLFTVGPTNVVVSHLGYYCSNAVSLAQVQSTAGLIANHYVGVFLAGSVPQLVAEVHVPAGAAADYYTNQFVWMPLDPPLLLMSNTEYVVAAQQFSGDGDLWGDAFYATFNSFFLGQNTNNPLLAPEAVFGPGNGSWPLPGYGLWNVSSSNSTYCVEGMANLPIDQARVGVESTNIVVGLGPQSVVGFASGQPPINYQWWQAGSPPTPVAGQTSPVLTFANATSANSGVYFLTASNALGGEQSANVFLTVASNPANIQTPPANTTAFNYYSTNFSVVVTGAPPIYVQWFSNNVPVTATVDSDGDAFTNTCSVIAQTANNGDVYTVVVSNTVNSISYAAGASATLTVLPNFAYPQHILHPPPGTNIFYTGSGPNGTYGNTGNGSSGGDILIGNNPVLITHLGYCAVGLPLNGISALQASHHVEIFSYPGLILLGDVIITNGTPATNAVDGYLWAPLNPPLLLSNNTTYVVSGEGFLDQDPWGDTYVPSGWDTFITPGGSVNNAVWGGGSGGTWPNPPNNGHYGSQIYSVCNMGNLVVSNQIFALSSPSRAVQAAGASVTLTGYVNGPPPVTVQWYQNGVALPGQTNITLTLNNLSSANAGNYSILATNTQASIGAFSPVSTIIVYSSPVILTALPQTYTNLANANIMTLYAGANPNFSVQVLGYAPLSYQWYTNGVAVAKATNANYSVSNIQVGSATNFVCIITNADGSATNAWSATVLPDPTNSSGGLALYPQSVLALNPIGYWRLNEPDCCGGEVGPDDNAIAFDYVGGNNGVYTNLSLGWPGYNPIADPSDASAQFGLVEENGDLGDSEAGSIAGINFASPSGTSKAFTIEAWVNGYSQTYDAGIVTLGWGGGGEQFNLDCGANDPTHDFRFFIRDASGTVHTVSSTNQPSYGTWYHLAAVVDEISNQTITLYINGQSVGSASCPSGSGILSATNPVAGALSLMSIGSRMGAVVGNFNLQFEGNIDDVAAFNYALSPSQVLNQYLEGGQISPYINPAPPASITAVSGGALVLPAMAFGGPVLGYQWVNQSTSTFLASGTGTANGTSLDAGYTNNAVPSSWNGQTLELTVTNAYGTTNVFVALTVTLAPSITTNLPPSINVGQGYNYTYYFGVVGEPPLGYQWYENGTGIPNATNATYTPSTSSGGTNTFYVIVTNGFGSATSVTSTFGVNAAPTNALATAIMSLNPIGYWPLNEIEPFAPGDIETNYGTLGAQANGYYTDWRQPFSGFQHNYPCPIGGDNNSVFYSITASGGGSITNAMLVNPASRATVLNPPFTVECWCYFTQNTAYGDIWSQNGYEGINAGGIGGGGGNVCGIRLDWGGNGANELTVYGYDNSSALNNIIITPQNLATNVWTHCVVTCDANTNFNIFTNGVLCATGAGVGKYSPDYWTPFAVGSGRGYTRSLPQTAVADVAIYTNVALSAATILNNYMVGTNPSPAVSYFQTVTSLNPPVFLRMDSPAYAGYPAYSSLPVLYGYGSAALSGVYTPGTAVGVTPGPSHNGVPWAGTPPTVPAMSGVSSFGDVPYSPAYNLTNVSQPFSVAVTFRCNPSDNRYQCILGRGDGSWRFAISGNNANGTPGGLQFAMGAGAGTPTSEIYPSAATLNCNDGNWHQAVGVFQPATVPNLPSSVLLYVDGQISVISSVNTTNNINGSLYDLLMGAAPDYTNNPAGQGRQFDGQLCNVALFPSALTAAQVQALYYTAFPAAAQLPLAINYQLPLSNTNMSTLYAGASPTFSVTLSSPPQSYQWYTNGVAVGSGTNALLTLPNVQPGFLTNYCIASDSAGSVTSMVWTAQIVADPDPAGSFSQLIMSDNPVDYWRLNDAHGSAIALDYAGGANGVYGSQTTNGLPGVPILGASDELGVAMDPSPSTMAQGTVTNMGINLYTNTTTMICWVLPTALEPNPSGLFENRSSANSSGFQLAGTTLVTNSVDYNWSGSSAAYNYGDPFGIRTGTWGMAVLETTPLNAVFYVYGTNGLVGIATNNFASQDESFFRGNEIGSDPNGGTGRILRGQMNELALFNYNLSAAQIAALYYAATNGALVAPYVVSQPQNATVALGSTGTFTVGASSFVQPLTYQWYYNSSSSYSGATALANGLQANGTWVTNATTAQLTITNMASGAAGFYFVAVGNSAGTSDSGIASLTVVPSTSPVNVAVLTTNSMVTLSWPLNHIGWQLQAQTNSASVGISTNWANVSGSTGTNKVIIPINLANGCVFYRLVYP
ncbi:MAG TPA: LamG-like jellyroll fold domain-containing protein [Verrucomicrobiae bacterium]|nr:LamG-like jellyroll fold domain-containing protein [Verrucomicrobiae bacterium]